VWHWDKFTEDIFKAYINFAIRGKQQASGCKFFKNQYKKLETLSKEKVNQYEGYLFKFNQIVQNLLKIHVIVLMILNE